MDIQGLVTMGVTGGLVTGGGGLTAWFVRRQINKILVAVENIPEDMKGVSIKINLTKKEIMDEIILLKIENARVDERIKFLEKK